MNEKINKLMTIINGLDGHLYTNDEINKARNELSIELMKNERYNEAILYFPFIDLETTKELLWNLSLIGFSDEKTIMEFSRIRYGNRCEIEYSSEYLQLCVSLILYDGNRVLLLNNKNHCMSGSLTGIQGHVNYDWSSYKIPAHEYIKNIIIKETKEEIGLSLDKNKIKLIDAVYSPDNFISSTHIGVLGIYNEIPENLSSNEPEKHDIYVVNIDDALTDERIDSWTKRILKDIKNQDCKKSEPVEQEIKRHNMWEKLRKSLRVGKFIKK